MSGLLGDRIRGSALSDVGMIRHENQDACALFSTRGNAVVAVVADGMGGHSGGSIASRLAVESILQRLSPVHDEIDERLLGIAIEEANTQIYDRAIEHAELRGMGTTIVALLFHPDGRAWVAHVGDSRAYRLRASMFEPLTRDHSVVAELIRSGDLSVEEARHHSRRNEILRSVGVAAEVQIEINAVSALPGDRFLLCSDGLSGAVDEAGIAQVLAHCRPEDATVKLIAAANEAGGPDNVTAIALDFPDADADGDTDIEHLHPPRRSGTGEIERIEADQTEARLSRARGLLILTVIVTLALVASIVALIINESSARDGAAPRAVVTSPAESPRAQDNAATLGAP